MAPRLANGPSLIMVCRAIRCGLEAGPSGARSGSPDLDPGHRKNLTHFDVLTVCVRQRPTQILGQNLKITAESPAVCKIPRENAQKSTISDQHFRKYALNNENTPVQASLI